VRRGEIWDVAIGDDGRTIRVLVASGRTWNEAAAPQCVQLVRGHGVPELIPFLVVLAERDPVTGVLDMGWLSPIPREAFVEPIGMLTGATMAKVSDCLRMLYEL
jgi:mRNA interferase MazF